MGGPLFMYYRNTTPIGDIDTGSLWKLENDLLILVDDDEYRPLQFQYWKHLFVITS